MISTGIGLVLSGMMLVFCGMMLVLCGMMLVLCGMMLVYKIKAMPILKIGAYTVESRKKTYKGKINISNY
jgi:hypothetical protein